MKEQLIFDPSITGFKDDHDRVGAHLVDSNGDVLTTGDGDADNVANTFKALDARSFAFAYDAAGDNWDRLQATNGALHVDIQDSELSVNIEGDYAEDTAHASGDRGLFGLSIRIDDIDGSNAALLADTNGDYQGTFTNQKGELYVKDADVLAKLNSSIEVTATDLDIRDLSHLQDSIKIGDGTEFLEINADGSVNAVVTGTDFDIRDLSAAQDSVSSWIKDSNGDDLQAYNDELRTTDIVNTLENSTRKDIGSTAAVAIKSTAALSNRKWAWLYNKSKKPMYVGASGITATDGFPFPPGSMYEFRLGAAAVMHVLGTVASDDQDLRVMEGAA